MEFAQKVRVCSGAHELAGQFVKRRHQRFWNVAATKRPPVPVLVWLACCNLCFLHWKSLGRRNAHGTLGHLYSTDKLFEPPMIFHTWRALDAATNINGVRHDCGDRASYILHVQTAGENQESGERQCRSRGKPIACLAGTTAEIGVICIDEHITIGERRGVFWLESRIS